MSFLTCLLNLVQKTIFLLISITAAFKLIQFIHNMNQTINRLHDSLNAAEDNVRQLLTTVEDLKAQIAEDGKHIRNQMLTTMDMQQKLVDQNIDTVNTTKDIFDIYDCLDNLDDRLLDLVKSEKTRKIKKQMKKERYEKSKRERTLEKERLEIEALDKTNPNEVVFDNFIADPLIYSTIFSKQGPVGSVKLWKLFQEWYDNEYVNLGDGPSNRELEEYMCRNFYYSKDPIV